MSSPFPSFISWLNALTDFGADNCHGDGTTDDTAHIEANIATAVAAGKVLYFPAGTYKITSSISLPDHLRMQGAGQTSIFYMPDPAEVDYMLEREGCSDVHLSNLKFQGDSWDTNACGPYMASATNCSFDHLWFDQLRIGFKLGDGDTQGSGWSITDIVATDCRNPVYISMIEDCVFARWNLANHHQVANVFDHCIYLSNDVYRCTFTDLTLTSSSGWGLQMSSNYETYSDHLTFTNTTFVALTDGQCLLVDESMNDMTFTNVSFSMADDNNPLVRTGDISDLVINGVSAASGGEAFIGTWDWTGACAGPITVSDGIYDGTTLESTVVNEHDFTSLTWDNFTLPPNFGNLTNDDATLASADYKRASQAVLTENASVLRLIGYIEGTASAPTVIKGAIYSDSGGSPAALLGTTEEATIGESQNGTNLHFNFTTPLSLSAGTYWLALNFGAAANGAYYFWRTSASKGCAVADTYSDGPSDPWGSVSLDNKLVQLYAQYLPD